MVCFRCVREDYLKDLSFFPIPLVYFLRGCVRFPAYFPRLHVVTKLPDVGERVNRIFRLPFAQFRVVYVDREGLTTAFYVARRGVDLAFVCHGA